MKRPNIIALGLAALLLAGQPSATAEFLTRSTLDQENTITIAAGDSSISYSETDLSIHTYRVASMWVNSYAEVWLQPSGQADYPIAFASTESDTPNWNSASLVFRFEAPAGKTFAGGTLSFDTQHMGAHNPDCLKKFRAATFSDEPNYTLDGSVRQAVDFSNALSTVFYTNHAGDADGSTSTPHERLILKIPTGVSVFYAAIGSPVEGGNDSMRLGAIDFQDVKLAP